MRWTALAFVACLALAGAVACNEADSTTEPDPSAAPSVQATTAQTPPAQAGATNPAAGGVALSPLQQAAQPSPPANATPIVRSGCGTALPAGSKAGTTVVQTLQSGGIAREYRLHLPTGYGANKAAPLVLNYHGLGGNAAEQEVYSALVPVSDREGFVLVTPNGIQRSWSYPVPFNGVDDVQMTRDLLDQVESQLCIDARRVYATGMSNGAFMASKIACELGDRIAAAAPVSGISYPPTGCQAPVPILAFHGTADRTVPFEPALVFGLLPYLGARSGIASWAAFDGCSGGTTTTRLSEHVTRESTDGCGKNDVQLVVVEGGGHTWPGTPVSVRRASDVTQEVSAANLMWSFFAAHPKG